MTPKEQLLCFIGSSPTAVDPIRIMKGLFVFTKRVEEGQVAAQAGYFQFKAMNFGPCAPDIYRSLEELKAESLVREVPVPGETWCKYEVTDSGRDAVTRVAHVEAPAVRYLAELRRWCDGLSFRSLLQSVYHQWPDYAVNSVLPHLRPNG